MQPLSKLQCEKVWLQYSLLFLAFCLSDFGSEFFHFRFQNQLVHEDVSRPCVLPEKALRDAFESGYIVLTSRDSLEQPSLVPHLG